MINLLILRYQPKQTIPSIMNGPRQCTSNKTGNRRFPTTAPTRPMAMVRLKAMVLEKKINS